MNIKQGTTQRRDQRLPCKVETHPMPTQLTDITYMDFMPNTRRRFIDITVYYWDLYIICMWHFLTIYKIRYCFIMWLITHIYVHVLWYVLHNVVGCKMISRHNITICPDCSLDKWMSFFLTLIKIYINKKLIVPNC